MSDQKPVKAGNQPPRLPPNELIEQLVKNQAEELVIRREELKLEEQKIRNTHEYAQASLNAQASDRVNAREHYKITQRYKYIFLGVLSVVVAGLLTYALHLDKEVFAREFVEKIVTILISGGGGYAIGKHQGKKETNSSKDQA